MSSYEEIKDELENLPVSWYPALLAVMVESAIKKKVFREGSVTKFVEEVEAVHTAKTNY